MLDIILGNVFSLFATISDSLSSSRKTAKGVLLVQNLSQIFYGLSAIALKGYSAAVQNAVSIVRNLIAIRPGRHRVLEWVLILLGVVLGLWCNNLGIVGLLPIIANVEYSLAVFHFQNNERALKKAFALTLALYIVFNVVILNFVAVICNTVVLGMTVIFLIRKPNNQQ